MPKSPLLSQRASNTSLANATPLLPTVWSISQANPRVAFWASDGGVAAGVAAAGDAFSGETDATSADNNRTPSRGRVDCRTIGSDVGKDTRRAVSNLEFSISG